eukprot:GEZU01023671.1.p1 GENE.GEZU01023671.1~~GEZU01023671.1.p1  ORF type:complete len:246 (-),score=66.99 GEZU01023671.1:66-707(-)
MSSNNNDGTVTIGMDPFAYRQFDDPKYAGGTIFEDIDKFEFLKRVNQIFKEKYNSKEESLKPGYAPFCKHLIIENFTSAKVNCLKITPENEHLLKTGYQARTPQELPVLGRWFPASAVKDIWTVAKYLDIILYSREQVIEETKAMGKNPDSAPQEDWAIVAIKAQDEDYETPMTPITMMRNALGKEEGGSGVKLDRQKYLEAVEYWKDRAVVA